MGQRVDKKCFLYQVLYISNCGCSVPAVTDRSGMANYVHIDRNNCHLLQSFVLLKVLWTVGEGFALRFEFYLSIIVKVHDLTYCCLTTKLQSVSVIINKTLF